MATASTLPLVTTPTAALAGTSTPPSPPAWYFHPSTGRDRLNYTFNGLAIGLKSVQPIATATILPGMQLFTPIVLQPPTPTIL